VWNTVNAKEMQEKKWKREERIDGKGEFWIL